MKVSFYSLLLCFYFVVSQFLVFHVIISVDIPIALCLWWSGSHNFLQYILKTKKEKTGTQLIINVLFLRIKICSYITFVLDQTVSPGQMFYGQIRRKSSVLLSVPAQGSLF